MHLTEGVNRKTTHLSHLHYAKLGTQARYMCFVCVKLNWKHKLQDLKQDGVVFKSAAKHQLELRLHLMKLKILVDLMF